MFCLCMQGLSARLSRNCGSNVRVNPGQVSAGWDTHGIPRHRHLGWGMPSTLCSSRKLNPKRRPQQFLFFKSFYVTELEKRKKVS